MLYLNTLAKHMHWVINIGGGVVVAFAAFTELLVTS